MSHLIHADYDAAANQISAKEVYNLLQLNITSVVLPSSNTPAQNSAFINSTLKAADALGGAIVRISIAGTILLASTLVMSKSYIVTDRQTQLKMAASATSDPMPMFRNRAYINKDDPTTYKVISGMAYSSATGLVTVTTTTAHNKSVGDDICPWGANDSGYNGTFRVHTVGSPTILTFRPDVAPTVTNATVSNFLAAHQITSMTWLAGTVTVTTTKPHNIVGTISGSIYGATPNGYNGAYTFTSTGASTFTYPLAGNPGASPASVVGAYSFPQMRLYTPDVGGGIICYGTCDFNGLWSAGAGGAGDPGNAGTNGSNAATPTTDNSTDFDIASIFLFRNWRIDFYGDAKNSREHAVWACHGRDFFSETINISSAGADGAHFTGPLTNIRVGLVGGFTNDNLFAVGTSDYAFFNMSKGDVIGFRSKTADPRGVIFDPVRLIGESQFVMDFEIEEITGSCYNCYAFHLMYDPVMPQGGQINVRNIKVGKISCNTHNSAVVALQPFSGDSVYIGPVKMIPENQVGVIAGAGSTTSTLKYLKVSGGENIYDQVTAGYGDIFYQDVNLTVDEIELENTIHSRSTNAGTAGNGWTFNQNGGNVKHLILRNCQLEKGVGLFQLANTIATKVDIINPRIGTPTQVGVTTAASTADITVALMGGRNEAVSGTMFSHGGSGVLDICGSGHYAPGTFAGGQLGVAARSAAQVMTIHNADLFIDARSGVTQFSKQRGQFCRSNVGGPNDPRYGFCTSDGSVFWTVATGAAGVNTTNG